MTEPDGMYGEEIRRALSAVADLVVPDGDGLDKIQQRTRHRSPAFAWFIAYTTHLPRALINAIRVPGSEIILMAKGESTVFKRLWARRRKLAAKASSPQAWLRPAIAAAGAMVMVAAIVLAVPRLHQSIIPASSSNAGPGATVAGHTGGPRGIGEASGKKSRLGAGTHQSGNPASPGTSASRCPGTGTGAGAGPGSLNAGGTNSSPPTVNSPSATASTASQARNASAQTTPCSSSSPFSHSSSPSSPGSSSGPPGTTTPPPSGGGTPTPTPPISPSGGTPSPTTSAVSNGTPSPGPADTSTGGS